MFDIAVDDDGNYIIVGHTTAGAGVVNWDYLALKVGPDGNEIWRKTSGSREDSMPGLLSKETTEVSRALILK